MTGIDAHISSAHMVLSRDLNPHDTLFAGREFDTCKRKKVPRSQ